MVGAADGKNRRAFFFGRIILPKTPRELYSMERSRIPPLGLSLLIAIVYFAAAELRLSLASVHQNVAAVWPPTGIAIASLLIFGRRVWPGVFLGALVANLLTNIPI